MTMRRIIGPVLAAAITLVWLAAALPVAACTCAGFRGFDQVANGEHLVVSGLAESRAGDALTIAVDRWFWGPDPGPHLVVTDQPDDMCALGPSAPVGERWLWVAWIGDVRPVVNSCQPSWSLADAEGQAALAQATARFGGIPMPRGAMPIPETAGSGATLWFVLGGFGAAAIVLFVGAVAISGRRGRDEDRP